MRFFLSGREKGKDWEMSEDQVIEYDADADILAVNIRRSGRVAEDKLLGNDVVLSFNERGDPVQIQVMDASRRGLLKAFTSLLAKKQEIRKPLTTL